MQCQSIWTRNIISITQRHHKGHHPPEEVMLHAPGHFSFSSGILSKSCNPDGSQGLLWHPTYHKHRHDLCIIKMSLVVKLRIAAVSNDSACQDAVIALYSYVLSFRISSSTCIFSLVKLSALMSLCFCLQPSNNDFFRFFTGTILAICCSSHLFCLKPSLPASLFISCL